MGFDVHCIPEARNGVTRELLRNAYILYLDVLLTAATFHLPLLLWPSRVNPRPAYDIDLRGTGELQEHENIN